MKQFPVHTVVAIVALIIILRSIIPLSRLIIQFPLNDFSVYLDGTRATLNGENPYDLWFFDRYNYPPAATLFFAPFTLIDSNIAEYIFSLLSVVSLWFCLNYLLESTCFEIPFPVKLLLYAATLRLFPVKLTLVLGQINLIILLLIVASYYYQHKKPYLSGTLLGLASVIKLTPAPLLIYFLLKKNYRPVLGFITLIIVINVIAIIIFGLPLSKHYYAQVLPELNSRITPTSLNSTYMNQSISALLGRFGIFGATNALIRYFISATGMLILFFNRKKLTNLERFSFLLIIATLFVPVFVWQHHFVFVVPAWLILLRRNLMVGSIFYLAFDFHFQNSGTAVVSHPLLATHFLVASALLALVVLLFGVPAHTQTKK